MRDTRFERITFGLRRALERDTQLESNALPLRQPPCDERLGSCGGAICFGERGEALSAKGA